MRTTQMDIKSQRRPAWHPVSRTAFASVFALLIYFSFYYRSALDLEDSQALVSSGGSIAALLAVALSSLSGLMFVFKKSVRFGRPAKLGIVLFIYALAAVALSIIIEDAVGSYGLRMIVEIVVVSSLFWLGYYALSSGLISITTVSVIICVVGTVAAALTLTSVDAVGVSVRRLTADGGKNYTANTFALSAVLSLILGLSSINRRRYVGAVWFIICIVTCAILVYLQGSRQASFILVVFTLLYAVIYGGIRRTIVIGTGVVCLAVAVYSIIGAGLDTTLLLDRYTFESVLLAGDGRLDLLRSAVLQDRSIWELIIGRPDRYELWRRYDILTIHPHNILVSMYMYWGMISCVIMLGALIALSRCLFATFRKRVVSRSRDMDEVLMAITLFIVPFIYVLVSGNFTRAFNFYLCWGLVCGWIDFISFNAEDKRGYEGSVR